jgi:hypothetical protein
MDKMQRRNPKSFSIFKKNFSPCLGTPVPRGIFSRQTVTREVFNTSSQSSEWELDMLRTNISGPGDANTAWLQVLFNNPLPSSIFMYEWLWRKSGVLPRLYLQACTRLQVLSVCRSW